MSAAAKLNPLRCACGGLLDAGHCRACEPVRISAATTDRDALLHGPELSELDRPQVIATDEGTMTFRSVPGGVEVEIDHYRGAIAKLTLPGARLADAVAALTLLGRRAHWGEQ